MPGYLLDTNHLSFAIEPVSRVRERIFQVRRQGIRVGTCVPVLCELEVGLQQMTRPDHPRPSLENLLRRIRLWPIEKPVARLYGTIFLDLRSRGRALSQVDIMLAALAKFMKLTILTADRDFEALPDIRTENWLA